MGKKAKFDWEAAEREEQEAAKKEREEKTSIAFYNSEILNAANQLYKEAKMKKHPYRAPESFEIESDQVKALCAVISEELYKIKKHLGMDTLL